MDFGKGLEVSTDGGQTWSKRGSYHGTVFRERPHRAVGPRQSCMACRTASACAVRSDDAGAHWQKLAHPACASQ